MGPYEEKLAAPRQARIGTLNDAVAKEKTAIESVVSELLNAVDMTHDTFSTLDARVQPVSAQYDEAQNGTTDGVPSRGSSQLCHALEDILSRVYFLQNRINTTRNKLEV